jgi:hypothetical protein
MDNYIRRPRRVTWLVVSFGLLLGILRAGTPTFAGTVSVVRSDTRVLTGGASGFLELNGDQLYRVSSPPIHLWQWNPAPGAYYSPMGCGAFSVAMALSVYDPLGYGSYAAAHSLYDQMNRIPLIGGTLEGENAAAARRQGYAATTYYDGSLADLMTAIDRGAPVILGVHPLIFGIGLHDVLLVGYRVDRTGILRQIFVDNPAVSGTDLADPAFTGDLGNQVIAAHEMASTWTGAFTPVFRSETDAAGWRTLVNR